MTLDTGSVPPGGGSWLLPFCSSVGWTTCGVVGIPTHRLCSVPHMPHHLRMQRDL